MIVRPTELERPAAPADRFTVIDSPVGPLLLTGTRDQLMGLQFWPEAPRAADWTPPRLPGATADPAAFAAASRQLAEYFAGEREEFELRLAPPGEGFHRTVWQELTTIPYGETAGYGQIAQRLGAPGAARAVGTANHVNPIAIVIPCHRVIGSDGSLTGYGGGMATKHFLLALEAQTLF